MMQSYRVTATAVLCDQQPLAAPELAHACGADLAWVLELVEVGIVQPPPGARALEDWRFRSEDLELALAARRLQRDFDLRLDAAALVLDLERELRRLRGLLAAQGLGQ